mmetsp:Transcript_86530/g.279287  ORF Transcript_86530/g.279287 Transcript_86530/m.279287 type:complete len:234 (-) Transcript_86530:790-1491(-)
MPRIPIGTSPPGGAAPSTRSSRTSNSARSTHWPRSAETSPIWRPSAVRPTNGGPRSGRTTSIICPTTHQSTLHSIGISRRPGSRNPSAVGSPPTATAVGIWTEAELRLGRGARGRVCGVPWAGSRAWRGYRGASPKRMHARRNTRSSSGCSRLNQDLPHISTVIARPPWPSPSAPRRCRSAGACRWCRRSRRPCPTRTRMAWSTQGRSGFHSGRAPPHTARPSCSTPACCTKA